MMCPCSRSGQVTSAARQKTKWRMEDEEKEEGDGHTFTVGRVIVIFSLFGSSREYMCCWKSKSSLKATLWEVDLVSTTADIWTANNKSFLGVNSSLDQQFNFGAAQHNQQGNKSYSNIKCYVTNYFWYQIMRKVVLVPFHRVINITYYSSWFSSFQYIHSAHHFKSKDSKTE